MKLCKFADNEYGFHCPGCGHTHILTVNGKRNHCDASWSWNGSMNAPTFTPSLNVVGYCHSFITEGKIQFLTDCKHALAGKTVDIPEWEDQ
jgi:hypothetical protein